MASTCQSCWGDSIYKFRNALQQSDFGKNYSSYMGLIGLDYSYAKHIVKDLEIFHQLQNRFCEIDIRSYHALFKRLVLPLGGGTDHTRSGDENGKAILRSLIYAACPNIMDKDQCNDSFRCEDTQFKVHVPCHLSGQPSQVTSSFRRTQDCLALCVSSLQLDTICQADLLLEYSIQQLPCIFVGDSEKSSTPSVLRGKRQALLKDCIDYRRGFSMVPVIGILLCSTVAELY